MGLLRRRREPAADPVDERLAAFRAATVAAPEPPVSDLLQELELPYQKKGDLWLVEVGGAWATFTWMSSDASLVGFLSYEEWPGPGPELVRANSETGLAWYDTAGDDLRTRVELAAEDLDRTGLTLALGALRREAGGPDETALEDAPEQRVEEALLELSVDPGEVAITPRGDIADLRIELEPVGTPDEKLAHWMLEVSGMRGARLGIDEAGVLCAIAAIPARPVSAGGLGWALAQVRAVAQLYRDAS